MALSCCRWLEAAQQKYLEDVNVDSNISWAAYHANQQPVQGCSPTITAMLPLFPDDSKSVAMVRHSMNMVKKAVHELNPTQVPVITLNQPLYAIAKLIQWNWPDTYGEKHSVTVLGGLHIEMAALNVIGDWQRDTFANSVSDHQNPRAGSDEGLGQILSDRPPETFSRYRQTYQSCDS